MKLLDFLSPSILQKMKEDNISQLGDYEGPLCQIQIISSVLYPPLPPQKKTASNFRHVLSCGTKVTAVMSVTANDSAAISFEITL